MDISRYWVFEWHPSLTNGSNRSLRSLGRAKARPLTKRYTVFAESWMCYMKRNLALFLIISCNASANQKNLDLDPLAMANINCSAFYTAAQIIIDPEAKKEYESKASAHYLLSHQLSPSYERMANALNSEILRQASEIGSLKEREQVIDHITSNSLKCTTIKVNSDGVARQNSINLNTIKK